MRIALVNPAWSFEGSIYFGCRSPHLPLELGYCDALLRAAGRETYMADGLIEGRTNEQLAEATAAFAPDVTVVTTAPTYLFWRCAPPELRAPAEFLAALGGRGGLTVAVGPHASVTPGATLRKLGVDVAVRGECEDVVLAIAESRDWRDADSIAFREDGALRLVGGVNASRFSDAPALRWPQSWISRHSHHHHRFDEPKLGFGAEVEASRGCPYECSFCAKIDFRDAYRRRRLDLLMQEIDGLIEQGVGYIYFIDEIFLPQPALLDALAERSVSFGVQTRIDLWKPALLERLGEAGCVSIEAGLESLTPEGREALAKRCRLSTEDLVELLILARRHVPFVQANLIGVPEDDAELVAYWRDRLIGRGVWANEPVPLYPYPSSPSYRRLWGEPDDEAWERAHRHYLVQFERFSDIQDERPRALTDLEAACPSQLR